MELISLEPYKLLNGNQDHALRRIYLDCSPCYAGSVSLVLNLRTGNTSPQLYVVFYAEFSTVPYLFLWSHLPIDYFSSNILQKRPQGIKETSSNTYLYPQEDTGDNATTIITIPLLALHKEGTNISIPKGHIIPPPPNSHAHTT